jgi:hypothetical protein
MEPHRNSSWTRSTAFEAIPRPAGAALPLGALPLLRQPGRTTRA